MAGAALDQTDAAARRKVLLTLLAELQPQALPALCERDWADIDGLAALHRLQPLLHHRHQSNMAIPAPIRAGWAEAYRVATFAALQAAGELEATIALLEDAGHAPIALKGAWLAWHAYPHPALRPMRDIDLWLPGETIVEAYELLLARGYRPVDEAQPSLAQSLLLDKHLPPLRSPRGVILELHHRLWEIAGRTDHVAPAANGSRLRDRTIRIGAIRYLAPQDTLAHLIIHAVYDHRLDCGPLLLSDITALLRKTAVDWDSFWSEARDGGWERGAALVLTMVGDHAPDVAPLLASAPCVPPVEDAADLLLQDLATRQSAGVWATLRAGGIKPFLLRIFARRTDGASAPVARDLRGEGGFAAWAGRRLLRTSRDLARSDVRRQSRQLASLSRWLDT